MNIVRITLCGDAEIFNCYEVLDKKAFITSGSSFDLIDAGLIDDWCHEIALLKSVEVYVDDEPIKKKGKYIKRKDYLSQWLTNPMVVYEAGYTEIEQTFTITLKDDEEFDTMKLQLMKSDYEVNFSPYGIIFSHIVYDGVEIKGDIDQMDLTNGCCDEWDDYCDIIDYDLPARAW